MPEIQPSRRDLRVDLLRGLALLSIFVDHIPNNRLADFTLHNFGFSDAAELFVILAGYSASVAYGRIFERDGARAGTLKVLRRCLKIYGVQIMLLLATLLVVGIWAHVFDRQPVIVGPILRDGLKGTLRGLTLGALPTYLDILPLYIVLLGAFPLIRLGLSRSPPLTLGLSVLLWGVANVLHWNLPNFIEPAEATVWYFNPFTWQLVFVLGAAAGHWSRQEPHLLVAPPRALVILCWAYLAFAFVAMDAWKLWAAPFGQSFPSTVFPFALFGNEPKSFVTPWRLLHIVAITYLALTSTGLTRIARAAIVKPVVQCGRHSLAVFAAGCLMALFGRLIFKTAGVTVTTQILVNVGGLALMLLFARAIDHRDAAAKDQAVRKDAVVDRKSRAFP